MRAGKVTGSAMFAAASLIRTAKVVGVKLTLLVAALARDLPAARQSPESCPGGCVRRTLSSLITGSTR